MRRILLLALAVFSVSAYASEYTVKTIPNPKIADADTYVSNPDGILKLSTLHQINTLLDSLEAQTGIEVAVVAVNSIGSEQLRLFATDLFKHWGVGKKGKDNGLLVLLVMDQRDITFETGYGLEGILPDAICTRIQTQAMLPEFKKGDYDAGMLAGIKRIVSIVKDEPQTATTTADRGWKELLPFTAAAYVLIALLSFLWVNQAVAKAKKDKRFTSNIARYSSLKRETSSITLLVSILAVFGGAVTAFMLASGFIFLFSIFAPLTVVPAYLYAKANMFRIRRKPVVCDACGGQMYILSEKEEDRYLSLAQQFEEQLHAVDYDVFVCDSCKNESIFSLDKGSSYYPCPSCGTKAFRIDSKKITVPPTYISAGTERITYKCEFCDYDEHKNNKIPRLTHAAVVGTGGGFSSGAGGFGGMPRSGSFGGGRSGGGGASSRW
ncbi:MAG: TPM domain-containing protein [Prevotellaceae bacterium]|jgi:uncharacterized protein|nr:TPM domain-containing protein [Prevotellaceae bacterium]